eukprot:TRINITY_DN26783_c0_g1_i1.p1 TRINITY_DN26783_c0_g1~~TRINITY_DN26783_c0_g1_i1.p1  ORF type:complete len:202 (+),score=62.46 TRINITY_DN26783_c0_g1_i1:79-684(+)
MSYLKNLVSSHVKETSEKKVRRKKMARGPCVCPPKLTLPEDDEAFLTSTASNIVKASKIEELWIGVTAASFVAWCETTTMGQRNVEHERKQWMRENKVSYDTLRKWLKAEFEPQCPVHTLRDITLSSGKVIRAGSMGWCIKVLDKDRGLLVRYKVRGEGENSRENFETKCDDVEPVHQLLQWGWRPNPPEHDSDSDSDDDC